MLKLIFKEALRRVAHDAQGLSQHLVSPGTTTRIATGAARALTRNWTAATLLAEASAARWSASTPEPAAPGAPLRVLFAARFGALSPVAEALALDVLDALELEASRDRTRPLAITLCGTSALAPAGAPMSALARRVLKYRVFDASVVSAADISAWVNAHDVVLTSNDFNPTTTATADIELAAMALGFARARGLRTLGFGVSSEPLQFSVPARSFLGRFAKKTLFAASGPGADKGLNDAGFMAVEINRPPATKAEASSATRAVIVLSAPFHDGGSTVVSPVAEVVRLGALLLGGAPATPAAPPSTSVATVASALQAADIPVTVVRVGPAHNDSELAADLVLSDSAAWRGYLDALSESTRVITAATDIAAEVVGRGLPLVRLQSLSDDPSAIAEAVRRASPLPLTTNRTAGALLAEALASLSPVAALPQLPSITAEVGS